MSKKLQSFGFVLLVSGTVLFGIMHLAIALYIPDRVYTATPPSAFVTVLNEIYGWVPYMLSIVFMVAGVFFSIYGFINKSLQKQVEEIKGRDRQWQQEVSKDLKDEDKDVQ